MTNKILTEKDIKRILFGATVLLGSKGENWAKRITAAEGKYSAEGSVYKSALKLGFDGYDATIAYQYMCGVVNDLGYSAPSLALYNDDPKTIFENIKEAFDLGINRIK